jgi:uncharacterized membrane protein
MIEDTNASGFCLFEEEKKCFRVVCVRISLPMQSHLLSLILLFICLIIFIDFIITIINEFIMNFNI